MKISELVTELEKIKAKYGDSYELDHIEFGEVEDALSKNNPVPMNIYFKPTGAKRPPV